MDTREQLWDSSITLLSSYLHLLGKQMWLVFLACRCGKGYIRSRCNKAAFPACWLCLGLICPHKTRIIHSHVSGYLNVSVSPGATTTEWNPKFHLLVTCQLPVESCCCVQSCLPSEGGGGAIFDQQNTDGSWEMASTPSRAELLGGECGQQQTILSLVLIFMADVHIKPTK